MSFEFITECFSEDHIPAKTGICYSSLKLSDFVDYLDATDGATIRADVAGHKRVTIAEIEVVRTVVERLGRPIEAAVATIVGDTEVAAKTGSREKYLNFIFT